MERPLIASCASALRSLSAPDSSDLLSRYSGLSSSSRFAFSMLGFKLLRLNTLRNLLKSKLLLMRLFVPLASLKAAWLPSIPESTTAQAISLQLTLKRDLAASALTAGIDLVSAGVALRLREICQTDGSLSCGLANISSNKSVSGFASAFAVDIL